MGARVLALVQLCPCLIPWGPDEDGRCRYCGKALAQPDTLDIPRRDTGGAAKEYTGPHRSRKRIKGAKK